MMINDTLYNERRTSISPRGELLNDLYSCMSKGYNKNSIVGQWLWSWSFGRFTFSDLLPNCVKSLSFRRNGVTESSSISLKTISLYGQNDTMKTNTSRY